MTALDRMVAENIHERGKEVSKAPTVDIVIPWQVKASLKKPTGTFGSWYQKKTAWLCFVHVKIQEKKTTSVTLLAVN